MNELEGILINKFPYKDKHIIAHLILRSGVKVSAIFYGGQGGGKRSKGNILQLGYLIRFNYLRSKSTSSMFLVKNYQEKWFHRNISKHVKGLYLLCFFCEVLDKFSMEVPCGEKNLVEDQGNEMGYFRILSNAIFNLEKSFKEGSFNYEKSIITFLTKVSFEFGIFPRTDDCIISGEKLEEGYYFLSDENGGFASLNFSEDRKNEEVKDMSSLRNGIVEIISHEYGKPLSLAGMNLFLCKRFFEYICYQQNININKFKTLKFIFE